MKERVSDSLLCNGIERLTRCVLTWGSLILASSDAQHLFLSKTVTSVFREVPKIEEMRDVRTLDEVNFVVGFPCLDRVDQFTHLPLSSALPAPLRSSSNRIKRNVVVQGRNSSPSSEILAPGAYTRSLFSST